MHRMAGALAGFAFSLICNEISTAEARVSRGLAQSRVSQPMAGLSFSRSSHRPGFHLHTPTHPIRPHHFHPHKHHLRNSFFVPHSHFRHHFFPRHPAFHHGVFFASPVVVSSYSAIPGELSAPPTEDPSTARPLITLMLRHRRELGLSPEQVRELEEIRHTYQREAIRYDAELRVAELEVQRASQADPVDLEFVRSSLEDIARLEVEMRLARLGAIEKGKRLLSPEQRAKLSTLLGDAEYSRLRDKPPAKATQDQP